jgi:hypothetical protein
MGSLGLIAAAQLANWSETSIRMARVCEDDQTAQIAADIAASRSKDELFADASSLQSQLIGILEEQLVKFNLSADMIPSHPRTHSPSKNLTSISSPMDTLRPRLYSKLGMLNHTLVSSETKISGLWEAPPMLMWWLVFLVKWSLFTQSRVNGRVEVWRRNRPAPLIFLRIFPSILVIIK